MIRVILLVLFLGANIISSFSQTKLNNYSYVTVPEHFEFLKGKDKYQLNSLTKFLFNKYGFHAFFENELPQVISRCEGLKADVIKEGGFIYTKLAVVLTDCNGNEIYRSPQGKSKLKDYRQAYSQALRRAFENIERLEVKQKSLDNNKDEEIIVEKTEPQTQNEATSLTDEYVYKEYSLIPNGSGYTVWKDNLIIGEALPASKKGIYMVKTSEFIGIGIQTGDFFSVERYEAKKPKLLPMLFTVKAQ